MELADHLLAAIPDLAARARTLLASGEFTAAADLLQGTPLEITYWCGDPSSPVGFSWFISVPLVADCGGLDVAPDTAFDTVSPAGLATGSETVVAVTRPLDLELHERFIGVGWHRHIVAVETDPQKTLQWTLFYAEAPSESQFSFSITSIDPSSSDLEGASFVAGDALTYTYGSNPGLDTTVRAPVARARSSLWAQLIVRFVPHFSATLFTTPPSTDRGDLSVKLRLDSTRIALGAYKWPSGIQVGFSPQTLVAGMGVTHVYLARANSNEPLADLEIRGTVYRARPLEDPVVDLGFQLVGFPATNVLRIVRPLADGGCEQDATSSFDLSKQGSEVRGRYKSLIVDGDSCDTDLFVVGSNLHRAQIIIDPNDEWTGDGQRLVLVGATANVLPDSSLHLQAYSPWLVGYQADISYHDPDEASWRTLRGLVFWLGRVPSGESVLNNGLFLINSYIWNIAKDQLDSGTAAHFRDTSSARPQPSGERGSGGSRPPAGV